MSPGQVEYIKPTIILELSLKNANFVSNQFPLNNNPNCTLIMTTVLSISFDASAVPQGSLDGITWIDLDGTSTSINGDDDIMWTLNGIQSLMYVRVNVVVNAGSSIVQILARGA